MNSIATGEMARDTAREGALVWLSAIVISLQPTCICYKRVVGAIGRISADLAAVVRIHSWYCPELATIRIGVSLL